MLEIETYRIEEVSSTTNPNTVSKNEKEHTLTKESRVNHVSPIFAPNVHLEKAPSMKRRPASFASSTLSRRKYTPSI